MNNNNPNNIIPYEEFGYYDEYGDWVTGYYDEYGDWFETSRIPYEEISQQISTTNHDNHEDYFKNYEGDYEEDNDGFLGAHFYEESFVDIEGEDYEKELEETQKKPKIIKILLAIIPILMVSLFGVFLLSKSDVNILDLSDTSKSAVYEDRNMKIADKEFLIDSNGGNTAIYNIVMKQNFSTEEIKNIFTEKQIEKLPETEGSENIILMLSDSDYYGTKPTLGRITKLGDNPLEYELKEKNWEDKPTKEQAKVYKLFRDTEIKYSKTGSLLTEQQIKEEVLKEFKISREKLEDSLRAFKNWMD